MTAIERLWENYELPLKDALHYADGRSCEVAADATAPAGVRVLDSFDLDEELADDPSWVSEVDGLTTVDLGEKGLLWGGEGSYGSEGFLARLTPDRGLVWAMFFMDSNPFRRIQLADSVATFTSTSGVELVVDIDDPRAPVSGPGARGLGGEAAGQ